jgi:hypothetical protein
VKGAEGVDAALVLAQVRTLAATFIPVDAVVRIFGVADKSVKAFAIVRAWCIDANVRASAVFYATLINICNFLNRLKESV